MVYQNRVPTSLRSLLQQFSTTSRVLISLFFIFYDLLLLIFPFYVVFLLLTAPASVSTRNTLESNCILKNHLNQLDFWSSVSIHLLDLLYPRANESLFPVMPAHTSSYQFWPFSLPASLDLPGDRLVAWCSASFKPHSRSKSWVAVWSLITEPRVAAHVLPQEQGPQPCIFVLWAGLLILSTESKKNLKFSNLAVK